MSAYPKAAFAKLVPVMGDRVGALAAFRTERFVPANTATTFALGNLPIPDFTVVFKNGTRLDDGAATPAYTILGKTITLHTAANGTDVFIVDYHFRQTGA